MREVRIAGAPISWGVCEVPGWGYQIPAERVLCEARELRLEAVEAGPDGFLPADPEEASRLLARFDLRLVGGFVPAVLHDEAVRGAQLREVERQAALFAAAGAGMLVLAAATGQDGYEETVELDDRGWATLFDGVAAVEEISGRHGLAVSVHPHFGTIIERWEHVVRLVEDSGAGICLDTGHLMVGGADPVEVAQLAADRVNHVHLKDVDGALAAAVASGTVGYEEAVRSGMYRPLGGGDVELERIVGLLGDAGYAGWYVLEQDVMLEDAPEGEGPVTDVRRSLEYLERLEDGRGRS
jgi:inosose dehydratase